MTLTPAEWGDLIGLELGQAIRVTREHRNMRALDLARAIGCTAPVLSRIETGKDMPSISRLQAIARRLRAVFLVAPDGVDVSFLD